MEQVVQMSDPQMIFLLNPMPDHKPLQSTTNQNVNRYFRKTYSNPKDKALKILEFCVDLFKLECFRCFRNVFKIDDDKLALWVAPLQPN